MLNIKDIKNQFPIFRHHPSLVYLDSAATSLKPQVIIDKLIEYYSQYSANIHRGIYQISETATEEYEKARIKVAKFINASSSEEIVFTKGTTEAINLLANCLSEQIKPNDEIVTTIMEHHSNFVPWQVLAYKRDAVFRVIDINERRELDLLLDKFKVQSAKFKIENQKLNKIEKIITIKTKILTLTLVSNVLGTINPVKEIIRQAKKNNPKIITIIDVAQAVAHMPVDVQEMGADFVVFSGHKMFGPTGIGVLWGKNKLLNNLLPYQLGGGMIEKVTTNKSHYQPSPTRFEAGTPPIAEVNALGTSIDFINQIGWKNIIDHEAKLKNYLITQLKNSFDNKIQLYYSHSQKNQSSLLSFNLSKIHPHDIAQILDQENIAVRAGHHCTMPLHQWLGVDGSVRISLSIYNSIEDIDKLVVGLKKVVKMLG